MANVKGTPKDAQVMASILKDMGVMEYEPRVLNQMLEFAYRYVTCILDEAQLYSSHAKKKCIDIDDVRLAIHLQMDKYFTTPPPRELLLEIARQKNCTPLPLIKATAGLRLPPDRYSLTACNYHLKSATKKQRTVPSSSRISLQSLQTSSSGKLNSAVNLSSKTGATLAVVTKAVSSPTVAVVSRTNNVNTVTPKAAPTPIIKFSDGNKSSTPTTPSSNVITTTESVSATEVLIPPVSLLNTELSSTAENSHKRKRDDDADDYDV